MNVNGFLQPFSAATKDAFKLMLDLDAQTGNPVDFGAYADLQDRVSIVIPVVGDLNGEVLYRFPKQTAIRMVEMMCGMQIDRIDDFVTSAMGEMANIISGNAMTGLSEESLICDIRPPQILVGEAAPHSGADPLRTVISTEAGDVGLEVRLA